MKNNRIILDLNKAQWCHFYWVNQDGFIRHNKPNYDTVHGQPIPLEVAPFHPDYPGETMLARARRLGLIDWWTPVCVFQLAANHNVTYTGDKAIAMDEAWRARVFGKLNKPNKRKKK